MMMVMTYLKVSDDVTDILKKLFEVCNDIFDFFLIITETYLRKFMMMVMTNLMMPKTYKRKFTMIVMTYLKKILMRTKIYLRKFLIMVIIYLKAF